MGGKQLSRKILKLIALTGFVVQTGCLGFAHPLNVPNHDEVERTIHISQCQKNQINIFFLHGNDPFDFSNFSSLPCYLQSLGYIKTYFGYVYHSTYIENEIRKVIKTQPDSRVVLIGFSYGAALMHQIACRLGEEMISIDLIINVDGVDFVHQGKNCPIKCGKIVNVLSKNRTEKRMVESGEDYQLNDVGHFGTPSHHETIKIICDEVANLALSNPINSEDGSDSTFITVPSNSSLHDSSKNNNLNDLNLKEKISFYKPIYSNGLQPDSFSKRASKNYSPIQKDLNSRP